MEERDQIQLGVIGRFRRGDRLKTESYNGIIITSSSIPTMALTAPTPIPLGSSVPALTAHAISVSLPTWDDCIGYEEGDKRVVDKMETGYPRFFIHRSIQKVTSHPIVEQPLTPARIAMSQEIRSTR